MTLWELSFFSLLYPSKCNIFCILATPVWVEPETLCILYFYKRTNYQTESMIFIWIHFITLRYELLWTKHYVLPAEQTGIFTSLQTGATHKQLGSDRARSVRCMMPAKWIVKAVVIQHPLLLPTRNNRTHPFIPSQPHTKLPE